MCNVLVCAAFCLPFDLALCFYRLLGSLQGLHYFTVITAYSLDTQFPTASNTLPKYWKLFYYFF